MSRRTFDPNRRLSLPAANTRTADTLCRAVREISRCWGAEWGALLLGVHWSTASGSKTGGASLAALVMQASREVGKLYNALASGHSIDRIMLQLQRTGTITDSLFAKLQSLENQGATFSEKWDEVTKSLSATQGGMKNEMSTLDALQTKLGQADALMTQAFSTPFVEAQSKSIEVMTKATQNLTPVLKTVGEDLAVVSGLMTEFKTGAIENTLATTGMATALRGAWEVGKNLFLTLSAITAVRGALGQTSGGRLRAADPVMAKTEYADYKFTVKEFEPTPTGQPRFFIGCEPMTRELSFLSANGAFLSLHLKDGTTLAEVGKFTRDLQRLVNNVAVTRL